WSPWEKYGLLLLGRPQIPEDRSHGQAILPPEEQPEGGEDHTQPEQHARAVRPGHPDEDREEDNPSDEVAPWDLARADEVRRLLLGLKRHLIFPPALVRQQDQRGDEKDGEAEQVVVVLPAGKPGELLADRDEAEREGDVEPGGDERRDGQDEPVTPGVTAADRIARDERQWNAGRDDRDPPQLARHGARRGVGADGEHDGGDEQIDPEHKRERDPSDPGHPRALGSHDFAEDRDRESADDPDPDEERR